MFSGAFGFGVAANDKFLLSVEFDFDSCSVALSGLIPGATVFANQTFKSEFPNSFQKLFNILCQRDRITNNAGRLF
jgi:hypothetical protein